MVFSSPLFLFLFLPLAIGLYFLCPKTAKNALLLTASLLFYAWGDVSLLVLLMVSIAINFVVGLRIDRASSTGWAKISLAVGLIANLGLLAHFKYANFLVDNLNWMFHQLSLPLISFERVDLPLGISFFTFQAMSYLIDVYRGEEKGQTSFSKLALYISMFPQLVAGPIVRYGDVAKQLDERRSTFSGVAYGLRRFVLGLGKKVLVANQVGLTADMIFELGASDLTLPVAWLGVLCYSLQIYFDFSGYSDMAIGLGSVFGFRFPENFNYPYTALSITEFWQRWHITLSSWFRDYLYIPLGGNRVSAGRVYLNLMTVFLLCGLWHGASWNFVVWGVFHGFLLIVERRWPIHGTQFPFSVGNRVYLLLMVSIGWVFFRADNLPHAVSYLAAMAGFQGVVSEQFHVALYFSPGLAIALAMGIVGSTPWLPLARRTTDRWISTLASAKTRVAIGLGDELLRTTGIVSVLLASAVLLSAATHNPFIYFRF